MWMARLGEFFHREFQSVAVVVPGLERFSKPVVRAIPQAPGSWGAPQTPGWSW